MSHAGKESLFAGGGAAFLSAAATANAHWYSVKSLSDGVPSLAELLDVSNGIPGRLSMTSVGSGKVVDRCF